VRVSIVALATNAEHVQATRELIESLGVAPESIGVDRVRRVGRGLDVIDGVELETSQSHTGGRASTEPETTPAIRSPGKLCVSYSGQVYPCIFARFLPLGDVANESLGAIVARARAAHPARASGIDTLHRKLACLDCQLTAFALGAPS